MNFYTIPNNWDFGFLLRRLIIQLFLKKYWFWSKIDSDLIWPKSQKINRFSKISEIEYFSEKNLFFWPKSQKINRSSKISKIRYYSEKKYFWPKLKKLIDLQKFRRLSIFLNFFFLTKISKNQSVFKNFDIFPKKIIFDLIWGRKIIFDSKWPAFRFCFQNDLIPYFTRILQKSQNVKI